MAWLPDQLPSKPQIVWQKRLAGPGLGGIAATQELVVYGDRDVHDQFDEFHCLSAEDGSTRWTVTYPAAGDLDYGNSPRATPLIVGNLVLCQGAHGDVAAIDLQTGIMKYTLNYRTDFGATEERPWGTCSSPLYADGRWIVHPGAPSAAMAAIDILSGKVVWRTSGEPPAYGSFIAGTFGGVMQVIGHDHGSLGGWELASGKRLWRHVPPWDDDFNVPTPLAVHGRLLVASENNGTRLYEFDDRGRIVPQPLATNKVLAPDIVTPVEAGGLIFGLGSELVCLDPAEGLETRWTHADTAFRVHGSFIASDDRLLIAAASGELILVDVTAETYRELSRLKVLETEDAELYSHPALVGDRLYIRGENQILCIDLH